MPYSAHGEVLGAVSLQTQGGRSIAAQVIRPHDSPQTLSFMRQEADRWRRQANDYYQLYREGRLSKTIYTRAYFAGEVLWVAAKLLAGGQANVLMVEQVGDAEIGNGTILGVATYKYHDSRASISLQATEPVHQPTTPNGDKLRGIGTTLTRTMGREFLARGVQRVELVPLDEAAQEFWEGRHFHDTAGPILHMDGLGEIQCLVTACSEDTPDMPDEGDLVAAGGWQAIWGSVLPEVKRRLL